MKFKKVLLSFLIALTFVFSFAFAGCADCVTKSVKEPTSSRPVDPNDPDANWSSNY